MALVTSNPFGPEADGLFVELHEAATVAKPSENKPPGVGLLGWGRLLYKLVGSTRDLQRVGVAWTKKRKVDSNIIV